MEQRRSKSLHRDNQRLISQFDVRPLWLKMLEKTHDTVVPWNNKNAELEAGLQNMMGFSCMKAVLIRTHSLPPWQRKILLLYPKFRCIIHKAVSKPAKEIPDKEITVDPIRFVALP